MRLRFMAHNAPWPQESSVPRVLWRSSPAGRTCCTSVWAGPRSDRSTGRCGCAAMTRARCRRSCTPPARLSCETHPRSLSITHTRDEHCSQRRCCSAASTHQLCSDADARTHSPPHTPSSSPSPRLPYCRPPLQHMLVQAALCERCPLLCRILWVPQVAEAEQEPPHVVGGDGELQLYRGPRRQVGCSARRPRGRRAQSRATGRQQQRQQRQQLLYGKSRRSERPGRRVARRARRASALLVLAARALTPPASLSRGPPYGSPQIPCRLAGNVRLFCWLTAHGPAEAGCTSWCLGEGSRGSALLLLVLRAYYGSGRAGSAGRLSGQAHTPYGGGELIWPFKVPHTHLQRSCSEGSSGCP